MTGGDPDDCGWSLIEGSRLLASRGFDVSFADLVRMPNNWGPFMKVPDREEAKAILETGEAEAKEATLSFLAGRRYAKALSLAKFGPLGSRLMRAGFALGVKRLWSRFKVSAACTSCGLAALLPDREHRHGRRSAAMVGGLRAVHALLQPLSIARHPPARGDRQGLDPRAMDRTALQALTIRSALPVR